MEYQMSLRAPETVRFQTSQRGVRFKNLKAARADFEAWLENGVSPAGAITEVHIWEGRKKRIVEEIDDSPRGEILRATIRRALRTGRLQIRARRTH